MTRVPNALKLGSRADCDRQVGYATPIRHMSVNPQTVDLAIHKPSRIF